MEKYPEPPPLPGVKDTPFSKPTHVLQVDVSAMPLDQLLELRNRVEQLLPVKNLKDLDLSRELVLQVLALQSLQNRVLTDDEAPPNQQAQVANALSGALTTLVKLQADVYTTERLKRLEAIFVDAINSLPEEAKHEAVARYTALLEKAS